jgi:hypothetical protein
MPSDRPDAILLAYTDATARRRLHLEPRSLGGYELIEERKTVDGLWKPVGRDIVSQVVVECGTEVIA